jgi:hypothetical protein
MYIKGWWVWRKGNGTYSKEEGWEEVEGENVKGIGEEGGSEWRGVGRERGTL